MKVIRHGRYEFEYVSEPGDSEGDIVQVSYVGNTVSATVNGNPILIDDQWQLPWGDPVLANQHSQDER